MSKQAVLTTGPPRVLLEEQQLGPLLTHSYSHPKAILRPLRNLRVSVSVGLHPEALAGTALGLQRQLLKMQGGPVRPKTLCAHVTHAFPVARWKKCGILTTPTAQGGLPSMVFTRPNPAPSRQACHVVAKSSQSWRGLSALRSSQVESRCPKASTEAGAAVIPPAEPQSPEHHEEEEATTSHPEATSGVPGEVEELSRSQLLWRAAKPPLYTVALIPLLVAAGAAYYHHGVFYQARFWSFLGCSVLVLLWLNLSNDAFDSETGVDKDKKESVVNITGSRDLVLGAALVCLALGVRGLVQGALAVGDRRVAALLAFSIFCGYIYQSPPFRLSYKGLGEPLCFFAFGPSATTAFFLYLASNTNALATVTPTVLAASVLVGITTSLILFCSHFHQIESDLSVGKMSPLVRLGTERGALVAKATVIFLFGASGTFIASGLLPLSCLPCLALATPLAVSCTRFIEQNHNDKSAIFMAKYFCTRLHTIFGLMLALGLALGQRKWF